MNFLLRLKHWQLFLLIIGLPIMIRIPLMVTMKSSEDSLSSFTNTNFLSLIPTMISMTLSLGWIYAIGTNFHKKLPDTVKMNLVRFKVLFFIMAVYALFFCIFFAFNTFPNERILNSGLFVVIIPIHIFSMFCVFYCLHFNARTLKAVELQRPVTFGDFSGEFLLLLFYPIGLWIIQPRINKFFDKTNELSQFDM